jgi:hypothetical protein
MFFCSIQGFPSPRIGKAVKHAALQEPRMPAEGPLIVMHGLQPNTRRLTSEIWNGLIFLLMVSSLMLQKPIALRRAIGSLKSLSLSSIQTTNQNGGQKTQRLAVCAEQQSIKHPFHHRGPYRRLLSHCLLYGTKPSKFLRFRYTRTAQSFKESNCNPWKRH